MEQKWVDLFAQVFADFPDERVIQGAREVLDAMEYKVQYDNSYCVIPRDVSLAVVHRSLHSDDRLRSGGFLTFEIAVGPHFTAEGTFNGVCEYGLLRLVFGLDGSFQDDFFIASPLLPPSEVEADLSQAGWEYEQTLDAYTLAEKRAQYADKKAKQENS